MFQKCWLWVHYISRTDQLRSPHGVAARHATPETLRLDIRCGVMSKLNMIVSNLNIVISNLYTLFQYLLGIHYIMYIQIYNITCNLIHIHIFRIKI